MDVLSTPIFLVSVIWQKQLKEKKAIISLLGLRVLYLTVREALWQEHEVAGHITSHHIQNRERGMRTGSQLAFSFPLFIQRETPAHEMESPTLTAGLLPQLNLSENTLRLTARGASPGWFQVVSGG